MKITGTLVNAFFICKRKAWLFSRQFNPDPNFDLLEIGRLVDSESFRRDKKEVVLDGIKIDLVKLQEGEIIVGEIKKSSKGLKAAVMQLAYYLWRLKGYGLNLKGQLFVPREKRRVPVELTEELEEKLWRALVELEDLLVQENPSLPVKRGFCNNCAFMEFCFS